MTVRERAGVSQGHSRTLPVLLPDLGSGVSRGWKGLALRASEYGVLVCLLLSFSSPPPYEVGTDAHAEEPTLFGTVAQGQEHPLRECMSTIARKRRRLWVRVPSVPLFENQTPASGGLKHW